jgi:glycosyltransferase involved in cell wall biosynthesis
MKVAQVSHVYLPHLGGIELYIKRLIQDLKKSNNEVKVITTNLDTPLKNREEEAIYFPITFSISRNPFSFGIIPYFKKNYFDVIHLHSIWFLPCFEAVLFKKNSKIITTIHGVYPDNASVILKFVLNLYKPFAKYIINKSKKVITLSNSEKEKLIKIFKVKKEKIVVIPNGIRLEKYHKRPKEEIILFTGRIIPDKNPEVLIKSAKYIQSKIKNFKIIFIGPIEENYKKELENLALENKVFDKIEFIKELNQSLPKERKELMDFYNKSKVFVSLGSWEGLPTRVMEAMQFEVPCVAYSAGGSSELVINNENGFIIDKLDEKKLAEKLLILLKNKKLTEKLGRKARETIKKNFNWEEISKQIMKLYKE